MNIKQNIIFFIVIIIVALIAFFNFNWSISKSISTIESSTDYSLDEWMATHSVSQRKETRIWKNVQLSQAFVINKSQTTIYDPYDIRVDNNNNIYILDWPVQKIVKFDKNGEYVLSFGKKGNGPDEFINITDFGFVNDTLYVCDPVLNKIVFFDIQGNYIYQISPEILPYRVRFLHNGSYFIKSSTDFSSFGSLYDQENQLIKKFPEAIHLGPESIMSMDSWMNIWGHTNCIFTFKRLGYLMSINYQKQEIAYIIKTINELPPLELIKLPGGGFKIPSDAPVTARNISIDSDKLYLYSIGSSKRNNSGFSPSLLDVYNVQDGVYLHSIKLNDNYDNVIVNNRSLFVLKDTNVAKWQYVMEDM